MSFLTIQGRSLETLSATRRYTTMRPPVHLVYDVVPHGVWPSPTQEGGWYDLHTRSISARLHGSRGCLSPGDSRPTHPGRAECPGRPAALPDRAWPLLPFPDRDR